MHPEAGELPEDLRALAHRNAVEVRNTQFGRDAEARSVKYANRFAEKGLWW